METILLLQEAFENEVWKVLMIKRWHKMFLDDRESVEFEPQSAVTFSRSGRQPYAFLRYDLCFQLIWEFLNHTMTSDFSFIFVHHILMWCVSSIMLSSLYNFSDFRIFFKRRLFSLKPFFDTKSFFIPFF